MKPVERLETFDPARFLDEYWQRRPCLIGGWLKPDSIADGELLQLAEAQGLPMRLVTGAQERADWTVAHGPFGDEELPGHRRDWTVLVQEVDKASRTVESVLDSFREFLPDWILDDIMISHAMPGGSVGAHVDAYDVFLVQAAGTRRWHLAEHFDPTLDVRFDMALLENWQPETELVVGPGELLYLPPGIAHHGVAVDECQTWSVGLRTPSAPELMFFVAESLAMHDATGVRLKLARPDSGIPARVTPGLASRARELMNKALELPDSELESLLAQFLTRWRLWPREPEADDADEVTTILAGGGSIRLDGSARMALTGEDGSESLTVNGEIITCSAPLARELARTRTLSPTWLEYPASLEQLLELGAIGER